MKRNCENCKHGKLSILETPCWNCTIDTNSNFEPKENVDEDNEK